MKYQIPLFAAVGAGLFIVTVARHQEAQKPPVEEPRPALPQPPPRIVFEPDLKISGHKLSGQVTIYAARNRIQQSRITLESLVTEHDRNIHPYPQYKIEEFPKFLSVGQSNATSDRPLPIGKTAYGFKGHNLNDDDFDKDRTTAIRMKVVVIEGAGDPKSWTNPTAVVGYSKWMPFHP